MADKKKFEKPQMEVIKMNMLRVFATSGGCCSVEICATNAG